MRVALESTRLPEDIDRNRIDALPLNVIELGFGATAGACGPAFADKVLVLAGWNQKALLAALTMR